MDAMKRMTIIIGMLLCLLPLSAQQQGERRFSPEKFEADLYQYIKQEAGLSQQDCDKFFPVYKEMRKKQHALFERQRNVAKQKPADEAGCMRVIQERDNIEVEQKHIQQIYHNKFFAILPPSKVYDVIQAEDKFHRHMLRQWGGSRPKMGKRNKD